MFRERADRASRGPRNPASEVSEFLSSGRFPVSGKVGSYTQKILSRRTHVVSVASECDDHSGCWDLVQSPRHLKAFSSYQSVAMWQ